MTAQLLDEATFRLAVAAVPLVSIDLVVRRANGDVLLGLRNNRPAQGQWFVPGGRVRKGETLDEAFLRLTQEELGHPVSRSEAQLLGVYEHFYDDSVFGHGHAAPSTHYVVLAHTLQLYDLELQLEQGPLVQHSLYRWFTSTELMADNDVHPYTQAYLKPVKE
jgi:colanic acid biosynthesis protein WcaH